MSISKTVYNGTKQDIRTVISEETSTLDSCAMSYDEEKIFNTYKYWLPFNIPMQPTIKKGANGEPADEEITGRGMKSLFNQYNALLPFKDLREDANMPLLDSPDARRRMRKKLACTIKDLVEDSAKGKMGRQIYNYSDFAYCRYLGRVSNNYLITLRRFPSPCGDKIDRRNYMSSVEDKIQNHFPDTGRLVTWLGTPGNEMSNILKYSYGFQWEDMEAGIDEVQHNETPGVLASIFNMSNQKYRTQVMQGMAGQNFAGKTMMSNLIGGFGDAPYTPGTWQTQYDKNKVYGPIDVIDKSKKRKRGLVFEQKFSLTFDYQLRSYYGVNGKAAMVDLLGNILSTTYTLGTFWGGERRYIGASQNNIFNNLPIFKLADKGGLNNPSAVIDALMESINDGAKAFSNGVKGESTIDKIKNIAKDMGGMLLGGMLNKLGRPQKFALTSLLSGAPVGCWHLTVGNPKSPIIEVGNLICTGAEIEHYGPLGNDNFPTGLRVKINLEHGKPRDMMGIEQMYGRGDTRIYSPMGDKILEMYNAAKDVNQYKENRRKAKQPTKEEKDAADIRFNMIPLKYRDRVISSAASAEKERQRREAAEESAAQEYANSKKNSTVSLASLYRYFGMENTDMISIASQESLYGAEKQKNAGIKK